MNDARMLERAISENWPIKDDVRAPLMARMAELALDKNSSPREAVAAAKAVLEGSRRNLDGVLAWIAADKHLIEKAELEKELKAAEQSQDVNPARPDSPDQADPA